LGQGETHSPTMIREAAAFTPQEDSEDNSSWVPYVLAGAGGLFVLCGLVALLVVRRRKRPRITDFFNKEGGILCDTEEMEIPAGNVSMSSVVGPEGYGKLPTASPKGLPPKVVPLGAVCSI